MTIAVKLLDATVDYDGSQLASLFAWRAAGLAGDSIVAFRGACDVRRDAMVDVEDLRAGARIVSPDMVHFIAEHVEERLETMVLRQRLFARLAADLLAESSGRAVRVAGDDVFVDQLKASVSVATVSPRSGLFHFGVNVRTEGVPVPAIGLDELRVAPAAYAAELLERYRAECADVRMAAAKSRWVG